MSSRGGFANELRMTPNAYLAGGAARSLSWSFAPLRACSRWRRAKGAAGGRCRQFLSGRSEGSFRDDRQLCWLRSPEPPVTDPILAAVAPHAGYQYSGPVAAYTYAALKGRKYSRVVIIAPYALRFLRLHLRL